MPHDGQTRFDEQRADRVCFFFESMLVHTKGRWARKPFTLTAWQRDDIVRPLFGTVRWDDQYETWVRQFSIGWLELARGNGKSELLAGIALYLTLFDDEESAEVYGAASDREQAAMVFNVAQRMTELSPYLSRQLVVRSTRKTLIHFPTNSAYRIISADAEGNLGQDPHGIVFDEIIAQRNGSLYTALRTGLGKRTQALMVCATTAGNNPQSFAATEHDFMTRVTEDGNLAPGRFVYLRNTPKDVDVWAEANWKWANPALGDFLSIRTLRDEAQEARSDPTKENAFRQFRLNQWVEQITRWMPLHWWDQTAGRVDEAELTGRLCVGGLDLAATTDLAALAWFFPARDDDDTHAVVWRFFMNEDQFRTLNLRMGGVLDPWRRAGWVTVTEGDVIDYEVIHETIEADAESFDVRGLRIDRWNATATVNHLNRVGIENTTVGGSYGAFSPGMKELRRMVRSEAIRHGGNPVARWNLNCVDAKTDPDENVKPVKVKDRAATTNRIDGIVALIYAIGEWLDISGIDQPEPGFISLDSA